MKKILFFCSIIIALQGISTISCAQGGAGGTGGMGGAGGAGGQNALCFKYVLRSDYYTNHHYIGLKGLKELIVNNIIGGILGTGSHYSKRNAGGQRFHAFRTKISQMQYNTIKGLPPATPVNGASKIKVFCVARKEKIEPPPPYNPNDSLYVRDTLCFRPWYNNPSNPHGIRDTIELFMNWRDRHESYQYTRPVFNIEFHTRYLIPITVPLQWSWGYITSDHKIRPSINVINAGMAYGWAVGRTKFFKYDQIPQRNFYLGTGPILTISSVTVTVPASASEQATMVDALGLSAGWHIGASFNGVQILGAAGYELSFGPNSTYWQNYNHFWFGIGLGLSLFNLAVPSVAMTPPSPH